MSKKISAGGKEFTKGETIEYQVSGGDTRKFIIIDKSKSNPPGLVLQNLNNKRTFAIDAVAVATRVKKIAEREEPSPVVSESSSDSGSSSDSEASSEQADRVYTREENSPHSRGSFSRSTSRGKGFGKRFFGAIGAMSSNAKAKISQATNNTSGLDSKRYGFEFLFLAVIFVHLLDAFVWRFSLNSMQLSYRVFAYLVLSFIACYVFKVDILEGIYHFFFKVSIVPVFIIPLLSALMNIVGISDFAKEIVGTVLLAIPWWLAYLRFGLNINYPANGDTRIKRFFYALITPSRWVNIYFLILAFAIIFWLLTTFIIPNAILVPGADTTGFNPSTSVEFLRIFFTETGSRVIDAVKGIGGGVVKGYKGWKNETMSEYYTGKVEENKELTGIFINDFHITGKQYASIPVVAYASIKARSFVEGINITTSCYAQSISNKSLMIKGKTDPQLLENIYIEDQRGVICIFDPAVGDALPAGRYKLFLVLDFGFKTWAYKPYYFMDREYYVYMKTSGDDPNTKLGIPKKSPTIYTNGPVMIGMDDAIEMPFAISSETKNHLPIGMTIDDKVQTSSKGQVVRVHNFTIRMPKQFEMGTCTAQITSVKEDENAPAYNVYLFTNPNINLNGSFMTVNCNVIIAQENVSKILPNANTPAMISIIGTTDYDYTLSKQISLVVEKTPGT